MVSGLVNDRAETSGDWFRHTLRPLVYKLLRMFATRLPSTHYWTLTHLQDTVTGTEESGRMQN